MLAFLLLALPFATALPLTATPPCSDILIITARGSNEVQAPASSSNTAFDGGQIVNVKDTVGFNGASGEGELGLVAQKVQNIIQKHTHLKVGRESVFYPALDKDSSGAINQTLYGTSIIVGIANLQKQIVIQAQTCPKQKLVLLGYSQGANLIGDSLAGGGGCYGTAPSSCANPFFLESEYGFEALNATYANSIASIVFWGDPRHNQAAQSSFTTGFPVPQLDGQFPRTPDSEAILVNNYCKTPATCKIQSICDAQDYFCGAGIGASGSTNITESVIIHEYHYVNADAVNLSTARVLANVRQSNLIRYI